MPGTTCRELVRTPGAEEERLQWPLEDASFTKFLRKSAWWRSDGLLKLFALAGQTSETHLRRQVGEGGAAVAATVEVDPRVRRRDRARPSRGSSLGDSSVPLLVGSTLAGGGRTVLPGNQVAPDPPARCGQHWSEWSSSSVEQASAVSAIAPSDQI